MGRRGAARRKGRKNTGGMGTDTLEKKTQAVNEWEERIELKAVYVLLYFWSSALFTW